MDQSRLTKLLRLKDSFLTDNSHTSLILVHFQSRTQRAVIIFYYLFFEDSGACEDSGTAQSERWIRKTWGTRGQPFPDTPRAFNYPWRKQSKDLLAVYQRLQLNLFEFLLQSTWLQILALLIYACAQMVDIFSLSLSLSTVTVHAVMEHTLEACLIPLNGLIIQMQLTKATVSFVLMLTVVTSFGFAVNTLTSCFSLMATWRQPKRYLLKVKYKKWFHISFTVCRLS